MGSAMSNERIKKLEDIGFVWDSHKANWKRLFHELLDYKKLHGDCDVPSKYPTNQALATWVARQRGQYKLYCAGKESLLTTERFIALKEQNFTWAAYRASGPSRPSKSRKRKTSRKKPEPLKHTPLSIKDYDMFMDV